MPYTGKFKVFEDIIQEMMIVYQHDRRPWLIGYSGGKDSTLLVALAYEAITRLPPEARTKKVYIITSDTLVENPIFMVAAKHTSLGLLHLSVLPSVGA